MTIPQSGKKDRKNNNSTHRKEKKIRTLTIPESDKNHAKIKQITIPESEKAIEKNNDSTHHRQTKNTKINDTLIGREGCKNTTIQHTEGKENYAN